MGDLIVPVDASETARYDDATGKVKLLYNLDSAPMWTVLQSTESILLILCLRDGTIFLFDEFHGMITLVASTTKPDDD